MLFLRGQKKSKMSQGQELKSGISRSFREGQPKSAYHVQVRTLRSAPRACIYYLFVRINHQSSIINHACGAIRCIKHAFSIYYYICYSFINILVEAFSAMIGDKTLLYNVHDENIVIVL